MIKRKVAPSDQSHSTTTSSKKRQKLNSNSAASRQHQSKQTTTNKKQQSSESQQAVNNNNQAPPQEEPVWIYGLINNIELMLSQFNAANQSQRLQQVAVQQQQQQQQQQLQQQQQQRQVFKTSKAAKKSNAAAKSHSSTNSSGYSTPSSLYSSASLSPPQFSSNPSSCAYLSSSTSNSPISSASQCQSPSKQTGLVGGSGNTSYLQHIVAAPTTTSNSNKTNHHQQQQQQQQLPRSPISRQIKFHEYKGPPQSRRPATQNKQHSKQVALVTVDIQAQATTTTTRTPTTTNNNTSTTSTLVNNRTKLPDAIANSSDCIVVSHEPPPAQVNMTKANHEVHQRETNLMSQPEAHWLESGGNVIVRQTSAVCQQQQQQQQQQPPINHAVQHHKVQPVDDSLRQQQQQHLDSGNTHPLVMAANVVRPTNMVDGCGKAVLVGQLHQQETPLASLNYRLIQTQRPNVSNYNQQQQQHVSLQTIRTPNGSQQQVLVLDQVAFQQMQQQQQFNNRDQKQNLIVDQLEHHQHQHQHQQQQQQQQIPILHNQEQQQELCFSGHNALMDNKDNNFQMPPQQEQSTGIMVGKNETFAGGYEQQLVPYDVGFNHHQQQQQQQQFVYEAQPQQQQRNVQFNANSDNLVDHNDHDHDDTCEIEPTISFDSALTDHGGQPFDENLLFSEFIDLQDIPLNVDESDWLRKFLPPCSSSSSASASSSMPSNW